ncbi:hypothetical protein BDW62DRAFT_198091 [Aspergillus aurantiobrunneus]
MSHNPSNYGWQHRSPQARPPSSMPMDQQSFSQPQTLPSHPGYPIGVGYPPPHHSASPNYYHAGPSSSQYFYSQHPGPSQNRHQPRSASIPYTFPSSSSVPASTPPMQEHLFTPSPPSYMVNQSEYYLAQGSSIPSNTESLGASPQPQPLMSSAPVYSSPDPAPAPTGQDHVRVLSFRPRPQCWDHGCNGREFSTFSNLLRHQRERSGAVARSECPSCGAAFTRSTARNIHVAQGKCKGVGSSSGSSSGSR